MLIAAPVVDPFDAGACPSTRTVICGCTLARDNNERAVLILCNTKYRISGINSRIRLRASASNTRSQGLVIRSGRI